MGRTGCLWPTAASIASRSILERKFEVRREGAGGRPRIGPDRLGSRRIRRWRLSAARHRPDRTAGGSRSGRAAQRGLCPVLGRAYRDSAGRGGARGCVLRSAPPSGRAADGPHARRALPGRRPAGAAGRTDDGHDREAARHRQRPCVQDAGAGDGVQTVRHPGRSGTGGRDRRDCAGGRRAQPFRAGLAARRGRPEAGVIATLSGAYKARTGESVILEVGGVGYQVYLPPVVWDALGDLKVDQLLHFKVVYQASAQQPKPTLFGFLSDEEREFFELLAGVPRLGGRNAPKAMVLPVNVLARAIQEGNRELLDRLPGVSSSGAEKIIASLRKKVAAYASLEDVAAAPV